MRKRPKSLGRQDKRKPVARPGGSSYATQTPLWSFHLLDDSYHKWQIKDAGEVLRALKAYEGMTWNDISSSSGGKRTGSNSHFVEIGRLIKEARDRMTYLHLDTEDMIYSLRIGSKKRLYGLLRSRVFEIIWYDENHEIYEIEN